jgi:hypothetical protein
MAKTDDGKKLVYVAPHKRDGHKIGEHFRTPPCPAPRPKPKGK